MNEMDYGLKELKWNAINEVDNVTIEELTLNDYVMWCKPITEQRCAGVREDCGLSKELLVDVYII